MSDTTKLCCAVTYYSAIIAWALYYFFASFMWPFPWATDVCAADDAECMADPCLLYTSPSPRD